MEMTDQSSSKTNKLKKKQSKPSSSATSTMTRSNSYGSLPPDEEMPDVDSTTSNRSNSRRVLGGRRCNVNVNGIFWMRIGLAMATILLGGVGLYYRYATTTTNDNASSALFLRGGIASHSSQYDQKLPSPFFISLWLIPPLDVTKQLQPIIDELSQEQFNASVSFVPHITVTGGLPVSSLTELDEIVKDLRTALQLPGGIDCTFETFPQTNTKTTDDKSHHEEVIWSQALILKMKLSETYVQICEQSRQSIFKIQNKDQDLDPSAPCSYPHMSLLYTNEYPTAEIHDKSLHELNLPLQFTSTKIALYITTPSSVEGVKEWKSYAEFDI